MRIALVHMRHAETGGTERYLNHMAAYLATVGHDVTIVCRRHAAAPHAAVRFVVLHQPALGRMQRMRVFAKAVARHLEETPYDLVFGLGKTWGHDVVRVGGGCHQSWMELGRKARRQWMGVRFDRQWFTMRLALRLEAQALTHERVTRIMTNSHMVKTDVMQRYGIAPDRITVVHNGVDLERFHPRHRCAARSTLRRWCGFEDDHIVVLFLGTGYYRKGLDRLFRVFPALLRARPEARLLVVGRDGQLRRWQRFAERLKVAPYIRFLGGRQDTEVCYGASDLYVLPTRYDPFANTTLEALASGLPVITTETNGGSEVMQDGVHGAVLGGTVSDDALLRALLCWTERHAPERVAQAVRARAEGYSVARECEASTAVLLQVAAAKR
jgi:UDP-glucose:(heptosyl)LPS alpha-1,3-glucosyltransferase